MIFSRIIYDFLQIHEKSDLLWVVLFTKYNDVCPDKQHVMGNACNAHKMWKRIEHLGDIGVDGSYYGGSQKGNVLMAKVIKSF